MRGWSTPSRATTASVDETTYFDRYLQSRDALLASEDEADKAKADNYYIFDPEQVTYGNNPSTEMEFSLGGISTTRGSSPTRSIARSAIRSS